MSALQYSLGAGGDVVPDIEELTLHGLVSVDELDVRHGGGGGGE